MLFILGYISGLLTAVLIVATLAYFRRVIEHKITTIEKQIDVVGPRPKGYIIDPEDESEEIRSKIISKNKKRGVDTLIDDLR